MTRTFLAAALALAATSAMAQTQQELDAKGTQIEVRESYRSDPSGSASSVETTIQRADGSGKHLGQEEAVKIAPAPAPSPRLAPPVSSTTTTTTINRQ